MFDEAGGYAWCQSARDRYVGYVEASSLRLGRSAETDPLCRHARRLSLRRRPICASPVVDFLPRHAPVAVAQSGFDIRGTAYAWLDPAGFLPVSCLSAVPPRSADLTAAASLYLGCPYLWGGRSFLGLDCSGLVQQAFRDLGIAVPRDTDMQRERSATRCRRRRCADLAATI